jgi:hypothetical protein
MKTFSRYAFLICAVFLFSGCAQPQPIPVQAVDAQNTVFRTITNSQAPETGASYRMLGSRPGFLGQVVAYWMCRPAAPNAPAAIISGYEIVQEFRGQEGKSSQGIAFEKPLPAAHSLIEFIADTQIQGSEKRNILFGRILSPEVRALEVVYADEQRLPWQVVGNGFLLFRQEPVDWTELRILGENDQVLKTYDLTLENPTLSERDEHGEQNCPEDPSLLPTPEPSPTALATSTPLPATSTPQISTTPPMTREFAIAYHYWQAQVVAFGGLDPSPGGCNPCGETWTWNGNTWSRQIPAHSPPARTDASMAFDSANQAVLLFGGEAGQEALDDTWQWNWEGQDWVQLHPATAPSPRSNAIMSVDYAHDQVVLWGGWRWNIERNDYEFLSDTWTWDGKNWTRHDVPGPGNGAIPPPSMTYNGNLKKVVMWQYGEGLWAWDGAAWEKLPLVNGPDRFTEGQLGFDEPRYYRRLVLRGTSGSGPSTSIKTWTFDGKTWELVEEQTAGEGNYQDAKMVYAFAHQALLLATPSGGKYGPFGLKVLAWDRSTWVDAATYVAPPPPVLETRNSLYTSNRTDLAICVQVEDPTLKDKQNTFRDIVYQLLDTRVRQNPKWKENYGDFAYRVDAECPSGPHPVENVDYPSEYKVHVYVMDPSAVEEITSQIKAQGMYDPSGPQMYEMFGEGWSDSFAPVTFALYWSEDQMEEPDALEQQLSKALGLP